MISRAGRCFCVILTMWPVLILAEEPGVLFEPARLLSADGDPIDVSSAGHAAPFYGDFDGDGQNDLLVGDLDGYMRVFRNRGANDFPEFVRPHAVFNGRIPVG
jgi:hypothetical protein